MIPRRRSVLLLVLLLAVLGLLAARLSPSPSPSPSPSLSPSPSPPLARALPPSRRHGDGSPSPPPSPSPPSPSLPGRLHGPLGLRADGAPAWTPTPLAEPEPLALKREHHRPNCFNLARSDSLPLDRALPDVRAPACRGKAYPPLQALPATSVVFVFYNEPLSPLLRSLHSVLNRSPPELLREIILVDDGSSAPWLGKPLEDYLALLPPKIKLVRMPERQGLMATRTEGARHASAPTVTFLDSHIECTEGWLEPLMARIGEDRRHVVMPVIDSIDADLFTYAVGGIDILGHSWSLGQKGVYRPKSDSEPMRSPVMAGGLFSIDRALFFELGGYDPGMKLYGGEEMEIAFRIWQCGYTLECVPCSHVGHIFRTSAYWQGQVYPVPGEVIIKNKLRAAAVWLDEYASMVGDGNTALPPGMTIDSPIDLSHMRAIRATCLNGGPSHSFKWYLQNVYPELFDPLDTNVAVYHGDIRNEATGACFDTLGARNGGSPAGAYPCHGKGGTQDFLYGTRHEIRVGSVNDYTTCLELADALALRISFCSFSDAQQFERPSDNSRLLRNKSAGKCLAAARVPTPQSPFTLELRACDEEDTLQHWGFREKGMIAKQL